MADHDGMRCEQCQEALSACLDGEEAPGEREQAEVHLAACADCRTWWDAAASITRLARTGPVPATPVVPDTVLQVAPGPGRARLAAGLRILLGTLGSVQLVLGMVQVSAATATTSYLHTGHIPGAGHLWHESAAWNVAIGAGFLWTATRRTRPTGLLPILTVFVAMLVLLSASDVTAGRVEGARLVSHAFVLAGYIVVLALTRPSFDFGPPPPDRNRTRRWRVHLDTDDEQVPAHPAPAARPIQGTARHRRAA
jgi:predicted anti-sigma-YlaC factor YlaD